MLLLLAYGCRIYEEVINCSLVKMAGRGNRGSKLPEDHCYSQTQRKTRQKHSVPTVSSESEDEIESYICGGYKKAIVTKDPPVECDFCDNAYCFKCSEVSTKTQYKKLSTSAKEEEGTMWFCIHCRTSVPGVKKMVVRVTKIEETQLNVIERLDKIEEQNEGLDDKIKGAILEQKEVDRRKLNIMCFGLGESTEEDAEQRNNDELAKIKHIIYNLLEMAEEDFPLEEGPVRIGKFQENKTRPLRFKAQSFECKKKLLQASRTKLKEIGDPQYKNLFFKPDLTKSQRAEAFAKRESRRNTATRSNKKDELAANVADSRGGSFRDSQAR